MDDLKLSDPEQRYFSDLYLCCDGDNSGKVTFSKACELFQTANISSDVFNKIIEISCQGTLLPTEIISRKQFFSVLKLIAAYQATMPPGKDLLYIPLDLPLPRFTWPTSESTRSENLYDNVNRQYGPFEHKKESNIQNDCTSTDSEVESQNELNGESCLVRLRSSPGASSTASDSPTPTNSILWPVCEEQRQLLATEEESSDGEISSEVWSITPEQKEYYTAQFLSLQSDLDAIIPGHLARPFFEKSRLPVAELRKIWQLADITRDGALNLAEFSIAMHLVVLRRNHIALPDALPESLLPPKQLTPVTNSPQTKESAKEWTKFIDSPTSSVSSPGLKPVNFDFHKSAVETDPKILHPVAVRVTPDINSVNEEEPRKSPRVERPDSGSGSHNDIRPIQRPQPKIKSMPGPGGIPPPPDAGPASLPIAPRKEAPPPPPPRPLRTHARSSSLDLNRFGKVPPVVPPRASPSPGSPVKRLVNQRSEGDILPGEEMPNDAFANFDNFAVEETQPETYENVLQSSGIFPGDRLEAERKKLFAQFDKRAIADHTATTNDTTDSSGPRKHGAFEVYRKPSNSSDNPSGVSLVVNKREMFKRLQEQNTTLLRICQELSQELADVREERMALRVRLEQQNM